MFVNCLIAQLPFMAGTIWLGDDKSEAKEVAFHNEILKNKKIRGETGKASPYIYIPTLTVSPSF